MIHSLYTWYKKRNNHGYGTVDSNLKFNSWVVLKINELNSLIWLLLIFYYHFYPMFCTIKHAFLVSSNYTLFSYIYDSLRWIFNDLLVRSEHYRHFTIWPLILIFIFLDSINEEVCPVIGSWYEFLFSSLWTNTSWWKQVERLPFNLIDFHSNVQAKHIKIVHS